MKICRAFAENLLIHKTVCFWVREFREGKDTVFDEPRSGRSNSSVKEKTSDIIRHHIMQDPYTSF